MSKTHGCISGDRHRDLYYTVLYRCECNNNVTSDTSLAGSACVQCIRDAIASRRKKSRQLHPLKLLRTVEDIRIFFPSHTARCRLKNVYLKRRILFLFFVFSVIVARLKYNHNLRISTVVTNGYNHQNATRYIVRYIVGILYKSDFFFFFRF